MRIIISILLIGAAIGAAAFGMLGLQGKMSRKPPGESIAGLGSMNLPRRSLASHLSRFQLACPKAFIIRQWGIQKIRRVVWDHFIFISDQPADHVVTHFTGSFGVNFAQRVDHRIHHCDFFASEKRKIR